MKILPSKEYQEIGIRSFGRGIFVKKPVTGADIGEKRVFWIEAGRLILNVVFAWEGAVAVTDERFDGLIGSHRFPMYAPKDERVDVRYVKNYLLTPDGLTKLLLASPGGAGRNRTLGQEAFLKITIPVPPVEVQREIIQMADSVESAEYIVDERMKSALGIVRDLLRSTFSDTMP